MDYGCSDECHVSRPAPPGHGRIGDCETPAAICSREEEEEEEENKEEEEEKEEGVLCPRQPRGCVPFGTARYCPAGITLYPLNTRTRQGPGITAHGAPCPKRPSRLRIFGISGILGRRDDENCQE